jgi:hypothetical protein
MIVTIEITVKTRIEITTIIRIKTEKRIVK